MGKVVYLWCDGDIPFYVGKGNLDRPYSKKSRNRRITYKRNFCEKNGTFNIFIVSSGLTNEYACLLEKSIIKNNPQLFNYTFGGDGGDTFTKLPEEEKIRRRQLYSNASQRNRDSLVEIGKKFGKYVVENKLGAHGYSGEQLSEWGTKGGKNTTSQKWMCLITGFISNPGSLSNYQRYRGIDTSLRKRIDDCN